MLTITGVSKAYTPATAVLHNINLTVQNGEIVCLLGPSGCGKTTLLRIVAGLEQADQGQLLLDGQDLSRVPVHQRNFGLMFQEFALFPHRTVAENIAFGLRMGKQSRAQIAQRVQEVLALVNLQGYDNRSVFALSGGERQRVALARSLAPHPRLLMLDEPLGSLDRALREALLGELHAILKAVGVTALYVTHDQQEAFAVADRLVVMRQGRIEQVGTAQAIYNQPNNLFVARFFGFHNLLPLAAAGSAPPLGLPPQLAQSLAEQGATTTRQEGPTLLIRPDAVFAFGCDAPPIVANGWVVPATVQSFLFRGSYYQLAVVVTEGATQTPLRFEVPQFVMRTAADPTCLQPGTTIWLQLDPAAATVIRATN
ncbi:MAG: ABC transporter ATP-binding protein [Caldilineaceae bacterium]|nr:ABC transporter ATP-binding protein [Caldilineaceae bacterium]